MKTNREPNTAPSPAKLQHWKLASLKPHPLQASAFGDLPDHELQALADDIERNGLRQQIEVLPDRTILKGHQRVRALELNGQTAHELFVRYDLKDATPEVIEEEFLKDNQLRRQLSRLAKARIAVRLLEIKLGKARGSLLRRLSQETIDCVGKALGMCGRNVSRYLRVLATPLEVQRAFDQNKLSLIVVGKVSFLDPEIQAEIAEQIALGEVPKAVVAKYLPQRTTRHVKPRDALKAFVRSLRCGIHDLMDRVDKIPAQAVTANLKDLQRSRKLIKRLLDRRQPAIGPEPQ